MHSYLWQPANSFVSLLSTYRPQPSWNRLSKTQPLYQPCVLSWVVPKTLRYFVCEWAARKEKKSFIPWDPSIIFRMCVFCYLCKLPEIFSWFLPLRFVSQLRWCWGWEWRNTGRRLAPMTEKGLLITFVFTLLSNYTQLLQLKITFNCDFCPHSCSLKAVVLQAFMQEAE